MYSAVNATINKGVALSYSYIQDHSHALSAGYNFAGNNYYFYSNEQGINVLGFAFNAEMMWERNGVGIKNFGIKPMFYMNEFVFFAQRISFGIYRNRIDWKSDSKIKEAKAKKNWGLERELEQ